MIQTFLNPQNEQGKSNMRTQQHLTFIRYFLHIMFARIIL
ncbi:unnamed protein product [Brugia timori]|uniref:PheST operon leader peptide PheM n=1 Tax=Brugia timori TaxID=42155 RepID=A0A0R3QP23_9BILA|nr:unnamed protein product [Brugia timori]